MNAPTKPSLLERLSSLLLREPEDREQLIELLHSAFERRLLDAEALSMIEGVLQVSETQVRDVMIPRSQLEAGRTLGLSEWQIFRLVRAPQALRLALAPMTNDFVALLKDSSLVSVITVVELTKQTAIYATNIGSWVVPGALCAMVYLAFSLPLARFARRLERRWSGA